MEATQHDSCNPAIVLYYNSTVAIIEKAGIICHDLVAALRGISEFVHFNLNPVMVMSGEVPVNIEIISLVSGGKLLSPQRAYELTRKAIKKCSGRFIFLYEDALLRGNISADIRALVDELQPKKVIFCTARPRLNRYILNGSAYIGTLPVDRTLLASDPAEPVTESHIPSIIKKDTGLLSKCIGLADIERGASYIASIIEESTERIVVCDARETHHLKTIAEALVLGQGAWVPCGSGGLIKEIPAAYGFMEKRTVIKPFNNNKPVVLAVGSLDEVSALQLAIAAEKSMVYPVMVEPADLWGKSGREGKMNELASIAAERIEAGQNIAITSTHSHYSPRVHSRAASLFATVVSKAISQQSIGGLVVIGADTAYALCKELRVKSIQVKGVIGENGGTLIAEAQSKEGTSFTLGTKGGAVGDEMEIVRAIKFMRSS